MASNDFLEEQKRRQRELVAVRRARQNPENAPSEPYPEAIVPKTFSEKVKNFWFYYKYFVLAGIFLAAVLTVSISQCVTREKYDFEVVLFSYNTYTAGQIDAMEHELEKYAEDFDGNGEVNIQIVDCSFSESEFYDQQNAKRTKLTAIIASESRAMLFMTDSKSYGYLDSLFKGDFFVDSSLPENDGKSLPLGEAFYQAVNSNSEKGVILPEGLQISRRIADENTTVGKKNDAQQYAKAADNLLSAMAKQQ